MSATMLTTGGQIPGTSRRERRRAKNALFVKARATAWVIKKTGRAAEKVEVRSGPLKRTDCKRIWSGAHGWKSHALGTPGEFSLSGREAATLLVCFGIPTICKVGGVGKGRRPSTAVIPRPKLSKRVLPQGEFRRERRRRLRSVRVAAMMQRNLEEQRLARLATRKGVDPDSFSGALSPHVREYLKPEERARKEEKEGKELARKAKAAKAPKPREPVVVVTRRPAFRADGRTRAKKGFEEMMAECPSWVQESDWKARLIARGYTPAENS